MLHTLSGSGNKTINKIGKTKKQTKSLPCGVYILVRDKENKQGKVVQYTVVEMLKVLKRKRKQGKKMKSIRGLTSPRWQHRRIQPLSSKKEQLDSYL